MFFISAFLILFSTYILISSIFKNKTIPFFVYFPLATFAQIILSFEILSLINKISTNNFLIINILFTILTIIYWWKKDFYIYKPNISNEIKNIVKTLKYDKILFFISICFIIFLISTLYISLFWPITFGDALNYTFSRCTTWIQNGNLNHFVTPDTREIIMPINIELLYTWLFLFTKKEIGTGIFSFISYILSIYLIYVFLEKLHFCRRKRLWAIFVYSAFALMGIMAYTPCSDLFVGTLILSSIYLFFLFCKNNQKTDLFFSSLAYSLAIGSKTTALMMIPSVAIIYIVLLIKYKKEDFWNSIYFFTIFSLLNFTLFSSYNYILNFIHFSNPITNREQFLIHSSTGEFKGFLCNFIKYLFISFDMSGIQNIDFYNTFITNLQTKVLNIIGETPSSYMSNYFSDNYKYNSSMTIAKAGFGALGLFAFIPSIIKSRKNFVLSLLSISLLINIIVISKTMIFCQYNIRYLSAFIVISAPVLALSYIKSNKNPFKILIVLFLFLYLFEIPHTKALKHLLNFQKIKIEREELTIFNYFRNKQPSKIALITYQNEQARFDIEKLKLYGFNIDKLLVEEIERYNLNTYKYIISDNYKTSSTNIRKFNIRENKDSFISPCLYIDSNMEIIEDYQDKEPAKVECLIPLNYFIKNGFNTIDEINIKNYIILRK